MELGNGLKVLQTALHALLAITVLKVQMTPFNILVRLAIIVQRELFCQHLVHREHIEIKLEAFPWLLACLADLAINAKKGLKILGRFAKQGLSVQVALILVNSYVLLEHIQEEKLV